jgi:hypothetical protein
MRPEDFCRWLQGMFDVSKLEELNEKQIAIVRAHLNTVFEDVTGYGSAGISKNNALVKTKMDPNYKENTWKVDPNIKTVLTC